MIEPVDRRGQKLAKGCTNLKILNQKLLYAKITLVQIILEDNLRKNEKNVAKSIDNKRQVCYNQDAVATKPVQWIGYETTEQSRD